MRSIAFIGKQKITQEEEELLSALGMALALSDYELITIADKTWPSCLKVAEGYFAAGGELFKDLKLLKDNPKPQFIVYADDKLYRQLDKRDPAFWTHQNWFHLPTTNALRIYTEALIAMIAESGKEITQDERQGPSPGGT